MPQCTTVHVGCTSNILVLRRRGKGGFALQRLSRKIKKSRISLYGKVGPIEFGNMTLENRLDFTSK